MFVKSSKHYVSPWKRDINFMYNTIILFLLLRSCRIFFSFAKKKSFAVQRKLAFVYLCTMYVYTHLFLITQRFYLDLGKPSTYILLLLKKNLQKVCFSETAGFFCKFSVIFEWMLHKPNFSYEYSFFRFSFHTTYTFSCKSLRLKV